MSLIESLKDRLNPARSYLSSAFISAQSLSLKEDKDMGWLLPASPLSGNPVLTAGDVTDYGGVSFVADPFLYIEDDQWHLFFEVQNGRRDPTAVIGHATSTDKGFTWEYDQVVLELERHLSFPYVFGYNDEIYLVPGQGGDPNERPITLFRALNFPQEWEMVADIVTPKFGPMDPVVFRYDDYWWTVAGGGNNDCLYVYYSDTLETVDWSPHAANPVVTDRILAGRPAGRPVLSSNGPILYLQDNTNQYGDNVRAYRITELTPEVYSDEPLADGPMLTGQGGLGWNGSRMHHIDAQMVDDNKWVCVTDGDIGFGRSIVGSSWSVGIFELTGPPVIGNINELTVQSAIYNDVGRESGRSNQEPDVEKIP